MNKTIDLTRSYFLNGKTFDKIVLREPTFTDSHTSGLGNPRELQPGPSGTTMLMTYPTVIDAYAQRLIVEPGYEYIGAIGAADSIRLAGAICDFFMDTSRSGK